MNFRALGLVVLAMGCESARPNAPAFPPPPSSLHVPLPDGWRGTALSSGLQAGPEGRIVLQLESTTRPLPSLESFLAAVNAEGVEILEKESTDEFVGVRYSVSTEVPAVKREAFLGVRQLGPRTIWCSTTGSAKSDEVEAAMNVCRSLSWEGS